jgi:hypothetical protein
MTTESQVPQRSLACSLCGIAVEICAFCEREECPEAMCYRCLRIKVRQAIKEPHDHGGLARPREPHAVGSVTEFVTESRSDGG